MEASGVMVSIGVPLLFVIVGQCCGIASRWFRLVVADVTEHTRCVVAGAVVVWNTRKKREIAGFNGFPHFRNFIE